MYEDFVMTRNHRVLKSLHQSRGRMYGGNYLNRIGHKSTFQDYFDVIYICPVIILSHQFTTELTPLNDLSGLRKLYIVAKVLQSGKPVTVQSDVRV